MKRGRYWRRRCGRAAIAASISAAPRRSSSSDGDDLARRGDRDIDGGGADFGERLRLGLGDPLLGEALAALQRLFEVARRLRGDALGLLLGMGDDRLRLVDAPRAAWRWYSASSCSASSRSSPRLVELAPDARGALVERADDARRAGFHTSDDEDHDRDEDPEFGVVQEIAISAPAPPARGRPPRPAAPASGAAPVSFSTTARADIDRDAAHLGQRLLLCRRDARARPRRSARPVRLAELRCRSAASAASRSAVSLIVACASARASASVF